MSEPTPIQSLRVLSPNHRVVVLRTARLPAAGVGELRAEGPQRLAAQPSPEIEEKPVGGENVFLHVVQVLMFFERLDIIVFVFLAFRFLGGAEKC